MVSGRPGVGKTAVVSNIYSHALEIVGDASFGQVIWVTGAWDTTLEDMHKEIALQMNIDLSEAQDDEERAKTLSDALSGNAGRWRILVVIDLWKDFSLEEIGIPKPTIKNGLKLKLVIACRTLLAGRSIKGDEGGDQVEDHEIECLSSEQLDDAYILFYNLVGEEISKRLSKETRSLLVERCDSLPYVIVNAGEGLKKWFHDNKNIEVGQVLNPIDSQSVLDLINFTCDALENSYQSLSQETRVYFLYCALFPHYSGNIRDLTETEDMIRYWISEGLMGEANFESTDKMFKRGREIVDEIKNAYLVEIVYDESKKQEFIQMRKCVREMAARISRTQNKTHRFIINVDNNGITKQFGTLSEAVERASVMSDQLEEFGRQLMNSLSTLVVRNQKQKHNLFSLPEGLFNNIPNVKVLELSGTHTESFPSSFHRLRDLRALHLRRCRILCCLPDMSCFLELLVLDLSFTRITELPSGLRMLTKLIRLDVSGTPIRMFPFPDGLLTALKGLKELLMMSTYLWTGQESGPDLKRLTKLAHLEANFSSLPALRMFVDKSTAPEGCCPPKFRFSVGKRSLKEKLGENTLAVLIDDIDVSDIKLPTVPLPVDISTLHLMFNPNLEYLQFQHNTPVRLQHLTSINVSDCGGLIYLFQANMLQNMANLRKIVVKRCKNMKTLIQDSVSPYNEFSLGNLQELVLFQLDQLCYICMGKIKCESLESISVWDCDMLSWMPDVVNRENKPILLMGNHDRLSRIIVFNQMFTKLAEADAPQELNSKPTYTDLSDGRPREENQSVFKFKMWVLLSCIVAFPFILSFVIRRLY